MKLEKYRDQIYSCLRCAFCFDQEQGEGQKICPPYATYGLESYGARGKMTIARALIDKEIEYTTKTLQNASLLALSVRPVKSSASSIFRSLRSMQR